MISAAASAWGTASRDAADRPVMAPAMARLLVPFLSALETPFVFLFLCHAAHQYVISAVELLSSKQMYDVQQACRTIQIHPINAMKSMHVTEQAACARVI